MSWWDDIDPETRNLARKLVPAEWEPDTMVVSSSLLTIRTPYADVFPVLPDQIAPLWTHYAVVARDALNIASAPREVVEKLIEEPARRLSPEEAWRQERGFDYE